MKSFYSKSIKIIFILFLYLFINTCQTTSKESFKFVFMTDIHVQPELRGDKGFKQAIAKVNQLNPDFVVTGGDLVFDVLGQSHERSKMLYDMYTNICKEFKMPVYNTLGNHEVFGLYEKSGISPQHPEYGKKMYKNRMGYKNPYYSFDHKGWHFMILDDIGFTAERRYIAKIDSQQIEWIKNDLNQINKEMPIVIALHIPLVSIGEQMRSGGTGALSPAVALQNSHEILSLFEGHNLKLVLQGHLHIVEEIIYKDTHFITGGAVSGSWWKGPRAGFDEGFVLVDIQNNDFSWNYETFGWIADSDM